MAHLNLLANAVLSLLRSTVGGLGVEPTLPAHRRAAIHQLTAALGALAENGEVGGTEAMAGAGRAARFADEAPYGPSTHALLIASIIQDCVRDLFRVIGAEPEQ